MATIGIIGYGIVGKATAHSLRKPGNIILWYDRFKREDGAEQSRPLDDVIRNSEFLFVCLPTESVFDPKEKRGIDLQIIDENIHEIDKRAAGTNKVVIIKSTVVPGTTDRYTQLYPRTLFCFNPEFLTEANYLHDAANPDRIVIGAGNDHVSLRVTDLYRNSFPSTPVYRTDPTTAEMVKYMANCYLATKVLFANEMYDLCNGLGIKYEEVKSMVVADKRIEDTHLDVTTIRGFGGKCFPKDMIALLGLCRELGIDASLLDTVWEKNLRIRKKAPDGTYDWEKIDGVVSKKTDT